MCFVCILKQAVAEKRAEFDAAAPASVQAEDLGKPEAEPAAVPVQTPEQEIEAAEMAQYKATTANINADSIFKLAQSAKWLYDANFDASGVLRTIDQLVYPAPPKVSPGSEPEPSTDSGMPPALAAIIEELRTAGFDVSAIRLPL